MLYHIYSQYFKGLLGARESIYFELHLNQIRFSTPWIFLALRSQYLIDAPAILVTVVHA